jgi:hypothetical protein
MNKICIILLIFTSIRCTKSPKDIATFDRYGKPTKDCKVRDAKGHSPYELLGRMNAQKCIRQISSACSQLKYKQIHKTKGYFARGKFGQKIMIGRCL